jgi:hypothetical protein
MELASDRLASFGFVVPLPWKSALAFQGGRSGDDGASVSISRHGLVRHGRYHKRTRVRPTGARFADPQTRMFPVAVTFLIPETMAGG